MWTLWGSVSDCHYKSNGHFCWMEWNGIKQCLLCFFMSLTVGTIHNLIYKFTTSVCLWRSSGPSQTDDRARPGKNWRGADWLWRWPAWAGWARESPCRSCACWARERGWLPEEESIRSKRAGHGRGVDSRKKNQFVQNVLGTEEGLTPGRRINSFKTSSS